MSWIDYVLPMLPAACLTLGFVHAIVWFRRRGSIWHLAFVAAAIAVAALTTMEHLIILARTPEDISRWQRLLQVPLALLVTSIVAFVRLGVGVGRTWIGLLAIALRVAALVAGFTTGATLYKAQVTGIAMLEGWGVQVPVPLGPANPWAVLGVAANLALLAFCADAWRDARGKPEARRHLGTNLVIGVIVAAVPLAVYLIGLASGPGWLSSPLAFYISFVPVIFAMGWQLSANVLASEQLETALRSSETRLAETVERSELAVAALDLALFSWDPLHDTLWLSDRARRMFALRPGTPVMMAELFASVHPDDRDGLRAVLADAVASRSPWDREFRVSDADGRVRWVSAHGSVSNGIDDGALLVHCVAADVTARHATADELHRLEAEAAQQRDELAHLARITILSELS
ncbi:MAG TPA: PAS domain-containing protein, partial [Xanthomonadales bacterium]|nr:PAS domain-containing protein [Xanthomonadales bacterium]